MFQRLFLYPLRFIFFSSTLVFIALIASCLWNGSKDASPSLEEKPYECGMFRDQTMRIDRRYLFFARVEYQGVDYWGQNVTKKHASKGCNDPISSATVMTTWPSMSPIGHSSYFEKPDDLNISLEQWILSGPNRNNIKRRFENNDMTDELEFEMQKSIIGSGEKMSEKEFEQKRHFNKKIGLYQVDVVEQEGNQKKVYWQETANKKVTLVISCLYFKIGTTNCNLKVNYLPIGWSMTSLKLTFQAGLLPHWQELVQDSEKLIQSFIVKEK